MRMWMIAPEMLCNKHLGGEYAEIAKHRHNFEKKHSMTGRVSPTVLIEPKSMQTRFYQLKEEGLRRGLNYKAEYTQPDTSYLPEWVENAKVDLEVSRKDLCARCPECRERIEQDKQTITIPTNMEPLKIIKSDLRKVPFSLLKIEEGYNTRTDYGDIEELMNSIIENGVIQPISGYKKDGFYFVERGHRRYTAISLGVERGLINPDEFRVPLVPMEKRSMEERLFDIILSNEGKPLNMLEIGETYKRLIAHGLTIQEIARKTAKSIVYVSNCLELANAPTELKKQVISGEVSASLAIETLTTTKDGEIATEILKEAVATKGGKITRKDVKETVKEFSQKKERKPHAPKENNDGEKFTYYQVRQIAFSQLVRAVESVKSRKKEIFDAIESENETKFWNALEAAILDTKLNIEKPRED